MSNLKAIEDNFLESLIIDKHGYQYFVNPICDGIPPVTKELLDAVSDGFMDIASKDFDYVLAPEAMAIHLASAFCMKSGRPFQVIRKREYGLPGEVKFNKSTGYEDSYMYINGVKPGDKVAIVDDVISTGGTLKRLVEVLKDMGVTVTEALIVLDKTHDLKEMEKSVGIPIKCLIRVAVIDGKATILD